METENLTELKETNVERLPARDNASQESKIKKKREKKEMIREEIDDRIESTNSITLIETNNYSRIWEACEKAMSTKKMIGLIGHAGAGKTTALAKFHQQPIDYNKPINHIFYVRVGESMKPKELFQEILRQTGETFYDYSLYSTIELCASKIARYSSKRVLVIIDEAGKLSQKMLEHIHEFRDWTKQDCGIVLAGPEYFHGDIVKMMNKGKKGMAEVYSRITEWVYLDRPTKSEIGAIILNNGIEDEAFLSMCIKTCNDFRKLESLIVDYKTSQHENQ